MTKAMKQAIEVLRGLPEERQATVAHAILDYASSYDDHFELSDEQAAEIERRMDNPNRTFLSLDETKDRLRHFGV